MRTIAASDGKNEARRELDVASVLLRTSLFDGQRIATLRAIAAAFHVVELDAGESLFARGSAGDSMAVVLRGSLGVRFSQTDRPYDASLGSGSVIGEMTFLDPGARSADVFAIAPTSVAILERKALEVIRAESAPSYRVLLAAIRERVSARLRVTNEKIARHAAPDGPARFATRGPREAPTLSEESAPLGVYEQFSSFRASELAALERVARRVDHADNSIVCREGDEARSCFVVVSGRFCVYRDLGRDRYELARLEPGQLFGQIAPQQGRRRSAAVRAEGAASLLEIDRAAFEKLCASTTQFALRFQELITIASIRQLRLAGRRYNASF